VGPTGSPETSVTTTNQRCVTSHLSKDLKEKLMWWFSIRVPSPQPAWNVDIFWLRTPHYLICVSGSIVWSSPRDL